MSSASEVFNEIFSDKSVPYQGRRLPLKPPTVASIYKFRSRLAEIDGAVEQEVEQGAEKKVLRLERLSAAALCACSDLDYDQALVVIRTSGDDVIEVSHTVMEMVGEGHFFRKGRGDGQGTNTPENQGSRTNPKLDGHSAGENQEEVPS